MWIAASFGFLMPAIRPPKTVPLGDDRTLQVRARRSQDLDILRAEYMKGKLGPTIHTPKFDYEYRAYCTPEAFAFALAQMIVEIDYTKFKPTTDRYEDNELHNVYNSMWGVLLRGLSSNSHQNFYWYEHPTGKASTEAAAKAGKHRGTGTGYPYPRAIETRSASVLGGMDYDEYERLQNWLEDADRRDNPPGRNTAADRDEAAREPEVIDIQWDGDDIPKPSNLATVDKLQDEIDAILDAYKASGPIDHSKCRHRQTPNAKAKCRAKNRKVAERQIGKLRAEMDRAYADAEADFEAEKAAESDPGNWKGYPWERGKPTYALP